MLPTPPSGQGPIEPRGAFSAPRPPSGGAPLPPMGYPSPGSPPPGYPPPGYPPPGYPPMPPFMMPPPRRGSSVKTFFLVMFLLLLMGSIIVNVFFVGSSLAMVGMAQQTVVVSGDSSEKVAVLPLNGEITHESAQQFNKLVDQIQDDANVKALVIDMDTPGGEVTASDEIYHRLITFKAAHNNAPVVVSMGALGTSGGYYVACAADEIFAQPTTITGNIGVLLPRYNFSKFGEKYGIEDSSIAATGTPYKIAGSAWKPENPDETAYIRGLIDAAFSEFRLKVSTGRKGKLTQPLEQIADGRAFSASEAHQLGLIDQIKYLTDACDRAATLANLKHKTVIRYERTPGIMQLFESARSGVGAPSALAGDGVQSGGGITLRIDGNFLRELTSPRPLYLWRGN